MKDNRNFTIVVLTVTAMILTALLVGTYVGSSNEAYASSASVKGFTYVLGSGEWTDVNDVVYVIDVSTRRMGAYFLDMNRGPQRVDVLDLDRVFGR